VSNDEPSKKHADLQTKTNSVALVRKRTIPTELPPLVGEVSANFRTCGLRIQKDVTLLLGVYFCFTNTKMSHGAESGKVIVGNIVGERQKNLFTESDMCGNVDDTVSKKFGQNFDNDECFVVYVPKFESSS
jgi:hypothetical protein